MRAVQDGHTFGELHSSIETMGQLPVDVEKFGSIESQKVERGQPLGDGLEGQMMNEEPA